MGLVIDHLSVDHRIRVLRDFTDVRGERHRTGESGVIRKMDLDWGRQECFIEWEREGKSETMTFALMAKDGPRNGHMREYFEIGDREPRHEDSPRARRKRQIPPVPELDESPVNDPERYADAVRRVWALAARRRFEEAEEQVRTILSAPDPYGGVLQQLADDLVGVAVAHALDPEDAVYLWAKRRAISLWYSWGSQATSGGEGAVREGPIRDAEARIAECDALRG